MPQSPSQALGEAIHLQVEQYLLDGKQPDLPSVENAMKKGYVPPTGGAYLVEEPKDYAMRILAADVPVKGRIDLLIPPVYGEHIIRVVDWKSASSFRYVPEPDVLTRDVQGVLYLRYAFENYPFATHGQFRHVYLLTKGTGSKKVDAEVVNRPFVDAQWAHIEQTVEEMKATATRSLPVVAQTQANLSHCSNYGGCSFRDRCPAASKGLVASILEAESQESAPSEGVTMSTLAEKLKARKAATMTVETPATSSSTAVDVPVVVAPSAPEPVVVPVATIIPPDAPGGDKVPEKAEGVVPPERSEGIMATLAKRRSTVTPKATPNPQGAIETKGAARQVIETFEAAAEVLNQPVVVLPEKDRFTAIAEAAGLVSPPVVEKPTAPASAELTLFVDCFPEKAPFDTLRALEDEIAARTPSLLEHLRKTSPKDVPEGTMDLGEVLFGRGYSTLSASFAVKSISGAWTVSTLGPASSKVLEVLLPKATFVVRGRR